MQEIHRNPVEVGSLSHYFEGLIHPRSCRISSINSMDWEKWLGQSQSSWLFWIQKQPWKLKASFTRPDSFSGKSATASNCSLMAWNIYTGPYATYCPCWSIHGAYMGYSFCSTPIGFYHKSPPQPGWSIWPQLGKGNQWFGQWTPLMSKKSGNKSCFL